MKFKKIFISLLLITFTAIAIFGYIPSTFAAQSPQIPLAGSAIPQFVSPLPTLKIAPQNSTITTVFGNVPLTIRMCEFQVNMLPAPLPLTWVWGYLVDPTGTSTCAQLIDLHFDGAINGISGPLDTSIGPVIVNQRGGSSTDIKFVNNLGYASTTNLLAYKYSTDQTLHWADPLGLNCTMDLMGMAPEFGSPCAQNYEGQIPAVVHLHGGEVPPELDGGPDSWFTSDGRYKGHKYYSSKGAPANASLYKYPNKQEAAPLWFHDHTLGATRLNVIMGMAGAYYIYDPLLSLPPNLQPLNEVIPVAIQDRMFDTNGQLFMPADSAGGILWSLNPEHPYWVPEFEGDAIIVNGKAWPYLEVMAKRYRFLFLNGSTARAYEMFLDNPVTGGMGPTMWVISTDGGYLDSPVKIDPNLGQKLVMQPGERYEVIIDFAGYAGTNLILRNIAKHPFPNGVAPQGSTLGRIMELRVGNPVIDNSYDPASGTPLRIGTQTINRLVDPVAGTLAPGVIVNEKRQVTLNEVMGMPMCTTDPVTGLWTCYPGGPLEVLLNNTKWAGVAPGGTPRPDFTPITVKGVTTYFSELPQEGDTEVWEIVNLTADAHPIHTHLTQFQLMNRQDFAVKKYNAIYDTAFPGGVFIPAYGPPLNYNTGNPVGIGGNPDVTPYLSGPVKPPDPKEAGWKDTVIMYPGEVTRFVVRYAPTDKPTNAPANQLYYPFDPSGGNFQYSYVWHCHIVDHEDNEMMRPAVVPLNPAGPAPKLRPLKRGKDY